MLLLALLLLARAALALAAARAAVAERVVPLPVGNNGANATLFLPRELRHKPPLLLVLRGLCAYDGFDAPFARAAAAQLHAVTALLSAPRSAASCSACSGAVMANGGALANETASPAAAAPKSCPAWDAVDACCQDVPTPGGDVAFVLRSIDAIAAAAQTGAVHVIGFSAGGFMALRLACDAPAGRLAGVVAYAGASPDSDAAGTSTRCAPAAPLPLQMLHARDDRQVEFGGGAGGKPGTRYAAAEATLAAWARRNRCAATPRTSRSSPLPPASGQQTKNNNRLTRVLFDGCAAPTGGWWLDGWGHFPPRNESTALFLRALRTNMMGG